MSLSDKAIDTTSTTNTCALCIAYTCSMHDLNVRLCKVLIKSSCKVCYFFATIIINSAKIFDIVHNPEILISPSTLLRTTSI